MKTNTILFLALIFLIAFFHSEAQVSIAEGSYLGRPHFIIETPEARWYYDRAGGGFSRLMDAEGNDWISFKKSEQTNYPASAGDEYRGLPNLVFRSEDGGAGHPGFSQCTSEVIDDHIIRTISNSGKWVWEWAFYPEFAQLNILQTDPSHTYWFLYEGTPGGRFFPNGQYWGNDVDGRRNDTGDYYNDNKLTGNWQWVYIGDERVNRVLFIHQSTVDNHPDMFSYLGNDSTGVNARDGMVVLGIGRKSPAIPLMTQSQSFRIGIYPHKIRHQRDHKRLQNYLMKLP